MWRRRLPHRSVGETFNLGAHETKFRARVRETFERSRLPYSLDDLQALFQDVHHFEDLFGHPKLTRFEKILRALEEELAGLWNFTRRADLAGRRPIELYVRVLPKLDEEDLDDLLEDDHGTLHVECEYTDELIRNPDFFTPVYFSFVEGEELTGRRMAPPGTSARRPG